MIRFFQNVADNDTMTDARNRLKLAEDQFAQQSGSSGNPDLVRQALRARNMARRELMNLSNKLYSTGGFAANQIQSFPDFER